MSCYNNGVSKKIGKFHLGDVLSLIWTSNYYSKSKGLHGQWNEQFLCILIGHKQSSINYEYIGEFQESNWYIVYWISNIPDFYYGELFPRVDTIHFESPVAAELRRYC